jgi:glycine betaine/proline transport system substrate-binding protein
MLKKFLGLTSVTVLALGLTACGGSEETQTEPADDNGEDVVAVSVGESVDYTITGIDPGAGLMNATATVIEEYELEDWTLLESSGAAMAAALKRAYDNEEPIIVTGWTPHWKFGSFDLKYLEDPKGVYGGAEFIHTIARTDLSEDLPGVYQVLDLFNWTADDMAEVMVTIEDGTSEEEAAATWIEANSDTVATWTEGAELGNGEAVNLAYVLWDSEIASTNVVGQILVSMGYDVTLTALEPGAMWSAVASGGADAHVAGWLPTTHEDYYATYEADFEDLGPNLEGTKIGLVVPTYMDIDSIEDLK